MTLPGNIGPRGQGSPHDAAVQPQGQERDQQGGDATFVPPTCHQVTKVPKEHTAGTNVVRRATEEPERSTTQEDDAKRHGEKDLRGSIERLAAGKTYCQIQSCAAAGYFRSKAYGT